MLKYRHIYCVPSHRMIGEGYLQGFFEEVQYANTVLGEICPLVFFDDCPNDENYKLLTQYSRKYTGVPTHYITKSQIETIYRHLQKKLDNNAQVAFNQLYPNQNVNYGNTMNKIFLIGVLFGADFIHRRDSDIVIDSNPSGERIFPIANEMKFLGQTIEQKIVYILGGGYKGVYCMDIEHLIKGDDYSNLSRLFSCMSVPENLHQTIINEEILNNNKPFSGDKIDFDTKSFPEGGNISLYMLHRYFPSPSQDVVLGLDYYFIQLASASSLNVSYHNRAVIHKHTIDRNRSYSSIFNYWKGFLLNIDSQAFYSNFINDFTQNYCKEEMNLNDFLTEMVNAMRLALPKFLSSPDISEKRFRKYMDFLDVLKESSDKNVVIVANDLNGPDVFDKIKETTKATIKNHIELSDAWRHIVAACEKSRYDDEVEYWINCTLLD